MEHHFTAPRCLKLSGRNTSTALDWPCNRRQPRSHTMAMKELRYYITGLFYLGYVKDKVFVPPLVNEVKQCITRAVESIYADTLHRVWNELDCPLDVFRVKPGANIIDEAYERL